MSQDPTVRAHQEWIGYVQPVGVLVSLPALIEAGAAIDRNSLPLHNAFLDILPKNRDGEPVAEYRTFLEFATKVLGWPVKLLYGVPGGSPLPNSLESHLPEYGETLRPTYGLKDHGSESWLLVVQELPSGTDFDKEPEDTGYGWHASAQSRMERLLRETQVPVGLLANGISVRVVYKPGSDTSGHATFRMADMTPVMGRPILAALRMLLGRERLFTVPQESRLHALLKRSRDYQNTVSTRLAGQVVEALFELLRGMEAANAAASGELLLNVLATDPNKVYGGLLTVLLRLVFLLYAEDRDVLYARDKNLACHADVYLKYYSITGLYSRLREDNDRHPDTMDRRFGGWARLLSLFRLVWSGARYGGLRVPERKGYLFHPDRYPFLEGRSSPTSTAMGIPLVSDGVLYRVLDKLLVLDGERLSYRNLDVEQIGSVYEAVMGFEVQVAKGQSIAIRPKKRFGAPATINLEELLREDRSKRVKWVSDRADRKLTGNAADALKRADTVEELLSALDRHVARNVTPNLVQRGAMIFQPSPERRRSGSHYTPRSLTAPIVEAALLPVLKNLGPLPSPERILALKVCDPAMGSGAFLVEVCRQLAAALVNAWRNHNCVPLLPPDEDELLHAQRLIAQRCLYGVDRNEMATDLAKLSLWLATLAKEHPFTFLDHSLRHGDALVGLTAQQVGAVHWEPGMAPLFREEVASKIRRATAARYKILNSGDDEPYAQREQKLEVADQELEFPRMAGDLAVLAYFKGSTDRQRKTFRQELLSKLQLRRTQVDLELEAERVAARTADRPVVPFHWEIEFPEVFGLDESGGRTSGFDAIVGNPPFAGKNTLKEGAADQYLDWLKQTHPGTHGNSDLVAHFYRRAFTLLKEGGCFGLIATNTIGQGDTRSTGLRWICTNGGTIYRARKRLKWPGQAAVVVSVVHLCKGVVAGPYLLDNRPVKKITAYLFHQGNHDDPAQLKTNERKSFIGSYVLGMGFTFDDTDREGVASPISEMHRLIAKDPRNAERIFPFLSGEDITDSPTHSPQRYVIDYEEFPLCRADLSTTRTDAGVRLQEDDPREGVAPLDYADPVAADWPDLLTIVAERVKGTRASHSTAPWWQFERPRVELRRAIKHLRCALAVPLYGSHLSVVRVNTNLVFANKVCVFPFESFSAFALLQCRIHEYWARAFGATLKDDLAYAPSDCFETFPFPHRLDTLEEIGRTYYEFRADLMVRKDEGLTKTYNRFHDPAETSPGILQLREYHAQMDRAVLDAFGWHDLQPMCEFIPEFDDDDESDDDNGGVGRRKFRYRWPDQIRDEVLTRLLTLNQEHAGAEAVMAVRSDRVPRHKRTRKKNIELPLLQP